MNAFPADIREWKNDVSHRLMRLRGAINDIMIAMPQIPDPEIGQPFTGPLSPVPFVWPEVNRSGGTPNTGGTINTGGTLNTMNTGGTLNTSAGCPGARFMNYTFSGTSCGGLNGTYKKGPPSTLFGTCYWGGSGVPTTTRVIWIPSAGETYLQYDNGVGFLSYTASGPPPNPGDTKTYTRTLNTTGCTGTPATIDVTGSDT